jgi:hypothetical protein
VIEGDHFLTSLNSVKRTGEAKPFCESVRSRKPTCANLSWQQWHLSKTKQRQGRGNASTNASASPRANPPNPDPARSPIFAANAPLVGLPPSLLKIQLNGEAGQLPLTIMVTTCGDHIRLKKKTKIKNLSIQATVPQRGVHTTGPRRRAAPYGTRAVGWQRYLLSRS